MKKNHTLRIQSALLGTAMLALISCSTMNLERYPEASPMLFGNATSTNGLSVVVQPLLDSKKSKQYFGVDLIENGILAVHMTIRNNSPGTSYLIPADSVRIAERTDADPVDNPETGNQRSGEVIAVAGAALISPVLLAVAAQQLSDASIIKENFEANRFRTTTVDPGETVGGFLYFNWKILKPIDTPRLCLQAINTIEDRSFPYCLNFSVKR